MDGENFEIKVDVSNAYDFYREALDFVSENEWVAKEYPIIYLLNNDEKKPGAYVGESSNARKRLEQQIKAKQEHGFKKVTIIGSDKFNKSVTLDFEARLIQCLNAEGTYEVKNRNGGHLRNKYYQDASYRDSFGQTWKKLIQRKIVTGSLKEIENSNLFKYSPFKALTTEQYNSVIEIIEHINSGKTGAIMLSGSAGTGKSILATYLIKLLVSGMDEEDSDVSPEAKREYNAVKAFRKRHPDLTVGLVIAMPSFRETIKQVFRDVPGLHPDMVIGPHDVTRKHFDLLLVDEAHRLRQNKNSVNIKDFRQKSRKMELEEDANHLDWILKQSKHQVFFYDALQTVMPSDVDVEDFNKLLKKKDTLKLSLRSQMRSLGGEEFIEFTEHLLNLREDKLAGIRIPQEFDFLVFDSFRELHGKLMEKEEIHGLSRAMAGYSWKWISRQDRAAYDIEIEGMKFRWNMVLKNWINSPNAAREIGCIHTTQGYDLNYVAVIFGKEIGLDPETKQIVIRKENYFDINGRRGEKDPEKLKQYILNIYRTSFYRGMRGVYVYACDPHLQAYLKAHIPNYVAGFPFREISGKSLEPYKNAIPVFNLQAAAGGFSDLQQPETLMWIAPPDNIKPNPGYFVCQVLGDSMSPQIPNGSWCLFTEDQGGSREGKTVLVQHYGIQDSEYGFGYTIKDYHSTKRQIEDGWRHETIVLKPKNPDFEAIVLKEDELADLKVVGVLKMVLEV